VARKHRRERTVPSVQFNSATHRTRWWTAANSPAPFARSVTSLSTPSARTSNLSPSAATSFTSFGKSLRPPCVFSPLVDANAVKVSFFALIFIWVCLFAVCSNGSSTVRKGRNTLALFASRVAGPATRAGFIFSQWGTRAMVGSFWRALSLRKMLAFCVGK